MKSLWWISIYIHYTYYAHCYSHILHSMQIITIIFCRWLCLCAWFCFWLCLLLRFYSAYSFIMLIILFMSMLIIMIRSCLWLCQWLCPWFGLWICLLLRSFFCILCILLRLYLASVRPNQERPTILLTVMLSIMILFWLFYDCLHALMLFFVWIRVIYFDF